MTALKRTVSALLVCCLLAAGCGGTEDPADGETAAGDSSDETGDSTDRFPIGSNATDRRSTPASSASDRSTTSRAATERGTSTDEDPAGNTSAVDTSTSFDVSALTVTSTSTGTSSPADVSTSAGSETAAVGSPSVDSTATPASATTDTTATSVPATVAPAAQTQPRVGPDQNWAPFASFEEVVLLHPSSRVERIGFHESNHDGARQMNLADTAVEPLVLESRSRGTGSRTAADIVVEPGTEIRAPVTGTVLRAGGYILYCRHNDDFVVIEPDAHPGWELKLLHITGVTVSAGDRVEAGITVLAPGATVLPFDSQVDEFTAEPSWPHVHVELVDPSIPDRPSTGGGC